MSESVTFFFDNWKQTLQNFWAQSILPDLDKSQTKDSRLYVRSYCRNFELNNLFAELLSQIIGLKKRKRKEKNTDYCGLIMSDIFQHSFSLSPWSLIWRRFDGPLTLRCAWRTSRRRLWSGTTNRRWRSRSPKRSSYNQLSLPGTSKSGCS